MFRRILKQGSLMLVLTRRCSEWIVVTVGEIRINIQLVDIRGDQVRLGFDAPREVEINRSEIQEIVDRERS